MTVINNFMVIVILSVNWFKENWFSSIVIAYWENQIVRLDVVFFFFFFLFLDYNLVRLTNLEN